MTSQPHNVAGAAGAAGLRTVGPYTLLAKIGEGGMGVVHLARRGDGPRVALKVLRSHIVGDDEARQRLAREVASLQRIRSRWVAEIVDADPWAEVPYVATRYVPGLSLHDHAQQEGPIVGADLLWFAGSLAEGLAAVHAAGVLHRDVKPSNVLMEGRTPIVIDFGLARVADDPRLTHTGWLLGTPGYLAPEILYGDDASPASDLHSWGATVAFAATGRAPFGRGPSMAIMDRVRRGEHDLTGLEGPLLDVVTATLDPEPTRRPTLEAVLAWLRPQTTRPAPVLAPPPTSPPTSGPGPARHVDDVDPFDAALALAAPSTDRAVDPAVDWTAAPTLAEPPQRDGVTRILAELPPTVVEPRFAPPAPVYAPAPLPYLAAPVVERPPLAERARRLLLVAAGALVTGAACMAAPWVTALLVVIAVWLLRSGSLAASAAQWRRQVRGRRWYDGVQLLVHTPWHLVQSIPGATMLLLWAAGLAVAAALVCYAVAAAIPITLFVSGVVLALSLWWGPGGSRLRGPLSRVVDPVGRTRGSWLVATVVLLALAFAGGLWVEANGVSWTPAGGHPFSTR